jgi:hypothetical protein
MIRLGVGSALLSQSIVQQHPRREVLSSSVGLWWLSLFSEKLVASLQYNGIPG